MLTKCSTAVIDGLPGRFGGLIRADGQRRRDAGAHGSGHGQPERDADGAGIAQHERAGVAGAILVADGRGTPAGRIRHQPQSEEQPGEGLHRAADGEDRAAQTPAAAQRHQGEEAGDDHEAEAHAEADDGAAPRVRILRVVQLGELLGQVFKVRDAFALEELAAAGFLALGEQAHVGRAAQGRVHGVADRGAEHVRDGALELADGALVDEPPVGEQRDEDHEGAGQRHHVPEHRTNRHDEGAHDYDIWKEHHNVCTTVRIKKGKEMR